MTCFKIVIFFSMSLHKLFIKIKTDARTTGESAGIDKVFLRALTIGGNGENNGGDNCLYDFQKAKAKSVVCYNNM